MEGQLIVQFLWISGKRIIYQGTDDFSRDNFSSGVMYVRGEFSEVFTLQWNGIGTTRGSQEDDKIMVLKFQQIGFANTEDWFDRFFSNPKGKWIWDPPHCLAMMAVEKIFEANHSFPDSQHVFVCPAWMTGYWRKMLGKIVDTMFNFKAGCCIWHESIYEPLTIAFVKLFLLRHLWKVKHLPVVDR